VVVVVLATRAELKALVEQVVVGRVSAAVLGTLEQQI
jgi:hypothetical protein